MRRSGWGAAAVLGLALAGLAGCKSGDAGKQIAASGEVTPSKPAAPAPTVPLDAAHLGTVSGTVHFVGAAPERIKIDMSQDPVCSMTGGENYAEQYVVKNGGLANVYVYVKSGPAAAMAVGLMTRTPVVLDQVGCKYVPHVVAVQVGLPVEFRNSDGTMHNVHTMPDDSGNPAVDVTEPMKGSTQTRVFKKPEVMMPVRCNNHPWMNAFINVSPTPFFAVSDAEGHFTIAGLPEGDYVLAAVHEKMGEQEIHVTVKPHQTAKAEYSFSKK